MESGGQEREEVCRRGGGRKERRRINFWLKGGEEEKNKGIVEGREKNEREKGKVTRKREREGKKRRERKMAQVSRIGTKPPPGPTNHHKWDLQQTISGAHSKPQRDPRTITSRPTRLITPVHKYRNSLNCTITRE